MFSVFKATKALLPFPKINPFLPYTKTAFAHFSTDSHYTFTVSYLINSCGLSPESALSASLKVKFDSPHKPDSVLNLLQAHGFTEAQISRLVQKFPRVLLANPVKILLPKIEFFQSIGVPKPFLTHLLSCVPNIFKRSLNNHIVPCYDLLKTLLGSDEKIVATIARTLKVFSYDCSKHLLRNVGLLRELGVPDSSVMVSLNNFPQMMIQRSDNFVKTVKQVKEMGFDTEKSSFVKAVHSVSGENKLTWKRSYEVYINRWGWSHDEVMIAFKKSPFCMNLSEKKIMRVMQYMVDEMGWSANSIAKYPTVLLLSLDKRIKPRCSIVKVLSKKGIIIKDDVSLTTLLFPKEDYFLGKFVHKYLEQVPQLLSVYEGDINVSDV